MADEQKRKSGFLARLFGKEDPQPHRDVSPKSTTDDSPPAAGPQDVPASFTPSPDDRGLVSAAYDIPVEGIDRVEGISNDRHMEPLEPVISADDERDFQERVDKAPPAPTLQGDAVNDHLVENLLKDEPDLPAGTEPAVTDPEPIETIPPAPLPSLEPEKRSWWSRLTAGLSRTSGSIGSRVSDLFLKRRLDAGMLEDLEDILIQADLGVEVAQRIAKTVGEGRYDKEIAPQEVRAILAREVAATLAPVARPLETTGARPFVILMVGVNGAGKTTTIGKLASKFRAQGQSVMLAAGDTFRAAAIEQLKVWGERVGAPVIARDQGADAAGLAFDALTRAKAEGADILMIDTAGRLQNRTELMSELEKVVRVIKKVDPAAPHAVLLVLDATVGQNALSQVELFRKSAGVTGLVMTKLDGTARGGILVALAAKFGLPVHFIGVGEGVDDLEPFAAEDFARAIAGVE